MKQELQQIYRELASGQVSQEQSLERIRALRQAKSPASAGIVLASTTWEVGTPATAVQSRAPEYGQHHVLLCDLPRVDARELAALLPRSRCGALAIDSAQDIADRYTNLGLACLECIQGVLKSKPQRRVLVQLVIAQKEAARIFAGLAGLLETATLENPALTGQIVFAPSGTNASDLSRQLEAAGACPQDRVIDYADSTRRLQRWTQIEASTPCQPDLFKEKGVYLITGGLGGLGILFAREIQKRTSDARIVLTGRSPLTEAKRKQLVSLQQSGHKIEYRQVDVADLEQVRQLIGGLVQEHGQLNGIIHSAGAVQDDFILKKSTGRFLDVLQPKVTGSHNLDLASEALALDFLLLFSSIASWCGNAGQADYAAANGFMNQFAEYRNQLVAAGKRQGRTLSLLWPHWLEGGMSTDPASMAVLQRRTGMGSLDTESGMQALYQGLASGHSHVLVMSGDLPQMQRALMGVPPAVVAVAPEPVGTPAAKDLTAQTRELLRQELAVVLKVPASKVDTRAPLESYGIDSIMAMSLTTRLEETFGVLAKTLFFEYLTIDELAGYFVQCHAERLGQLFAVPAPAATAASAGARALTAPAASTASVAATASAAYSASAGRRRARGRFLVAPPEATAEVVRTPAASPGEPIAIVGLSGRYPLSPDLETFWRNLRDGKDCIVEIPPERWDWRQYYSEDRTKPDAHYSKWGGFIEGVDEFDPRFFNISPREARGIDPQERLFLQHAWQAIEDAGYTRASLRTQQADHRLTGQVGVYAGVMYGEYNLSGSLASIANRVSYFLNLHGPSLTLDTMCSSSLTAIHLACQDLRGGRTSLALAGGVNVSIHPNKYRMLSEGQFISGAGHCQSFGEGGDGYIPGEGVGVAILKRLSDAQRDGNHIYGLIKGSALNHGGKTNGYTVPNPQAQADVIRQALAEANIPARHVSYVEAHGTGTKLGDPIEIAALSKVFNEGSTSGVPEVGFCRIGSAKSNIGHCESAAGIAGITKVLLQMKHRQLVPSLHSRKLNPHIDFKVTPFVVNQSLCQWDQPEVQGRVVPRIAGISSFGAGGSNAHIVLEEYLACEAGVDTVPEALIIPLSARTTQALQQRARDLLAVINSKPPSIDLVSLAYTLQVGREAMEERAGFLVSSIQDLAAKLQAFLQGATEIGATYRGQVKQHKDSLLALTAEPEFQRTLDQWTSARQLPQLLELWVKGLELDWKALVPTGSAPRLMSLPAYPFARERYWIEPSVVSAAAATQAQHAPPPAVLVAPEVKARSASTLEKPRGIVLQSSAEPNSPAAPVAKASASLSAPTVAVSPVRVSDSTVGVSDAGEGVFVLELDGEPVEAIEPLLQALQGVQQEPSLKVLLLKAAGACWSGDRNACNQAAQRGLLSAVARFAYPVIAVLPAQASGAGLLLGAMCDFMVCSEAGQYGFTGAKQPLSPNAGEQRFFQERLGEAAAAVLFGQRTLVSGSDLRSMGWSCRIVPSHEIDTNARKLASELAQKPQLALRLLKTHLTRYLLPLVENLSVGTPMLPPAADSAAASSVPEVDSSIADAVTAARAQSTGNDSIKAASAPASIALRSSVVSASAYPDGVVVVSLHDRQAKNMFSPALVDGLKEAFALIERSSVYKVVILTGYDSYFATGGTRETLLAIQKGEVQFIDEKAFQLPLECSLPVIAAMQGHAVGGGWSFGMFSDIALLSEESRYISPYMSYGFTPGAGSTLVFPKKIGYDLARETLLTAQEISGAELKARGLRMPVVPRRHVLPAAIQLAQRLAHHSRDQLIQWKRERKRSLWELREETYQREVAMHQQTFVGQAETLANIQAKFATESASPHSVVAAHLATPSVSAATVSPAMVSRATVSPAAISAVIDKLRELLAHELHLAPDEIDANTQFVDLGLDSITGVTWVRNINTHYGTSVEATKVYSYPTLTELARHVASEMNGSAPAVPQAVAQSAVSQPTVGQPSEAAQTEPRPTGLQSAAVANAPVVHDIIATLRSLLAKELHLSPDEIDDSAQFIDLGLDSITGVTWIRRINEHYSTSIEATKVYSYPTLKDLAQHVRQEVPAQALPPRQTVAALQTGAPPQIAVAPQAAASSQAAPSSQADRAQQPAIRLQSDRPSPFTGSPAADRLLQPIAVIGMAGQFAQAKNTEEFWDNLAAGRNCINVVPKERWSLEAYYKPGAPVPGKTNSKWLGSLEEYDRFDPLFFNISPTEAQGMDPQQRLFLQTCWHSIENAGYNPLSLSGSQCGVFVGCGPGDYHLLSREQQLSAQGFTGAATSILAARISYFLNLRGPCLALDTACSSSLVAIATACDSLNAGNSDLALAGGVYVMSGPTMHIMTSQAGMLSTDGRCFTFDQRANGFVPGEGVGVVVLKRLADAERDDDRILGVIEGWGVNQDGKTNGITAPNEESQTRLIQSVYRRFNIDPSGIQLIEAHGTGTKLGDPIEVAGLKAAFKAFTHRVEYCALGSVKSNIGHCLTAAGAAGVIKLLLALRHQSLPPTTNFQQRNEHIQLQGSPFYINDSLRPWNVAAHERRRAAISSFGFSGTNAHIVIAEHHRAPVRDRPAAVVISQGAKIAVCLSARTEQQLQQKAADLLAFIRKQAEPVDLRDLAYTLHVAREQMGERLGLLVDSLEALTTRLEAHVGGDKSVADLHQGQVKRNKDAVQLISQDEEFRAMIVAKWLNERKLGKLLELWVKGIDLDWSVLYGATRPRRIELPQYPFAKQRFWIEAPASVPATTVATTMPLVTATVKATATQSAAANPADSGQQTLERSWDRLSYLYQWEEQPQAPQLPPATHKTVLIACSGSTQQLEATIRTHYERNGVERVMLVRLTDRTQQVSADEWLCGIDDTEGFRACLQDLRKLDALYFLAMPRRRTESASLEESVAEVAHTQRANEVQLLRLVKCLKAGNRIEGRVDTYLLTLENYSLDRGSSDYGAAGVTGLGYSLAQGNYQFRVRNLDLSEQDLQSTADQTSLVTAIRAESASDRGEVIKLRGGKRYRQTFFKLGWPAGVASGIRHNGVYLILGGSGLIGQVMTRNLIEKYQANVVWLGRSSADTDRVGTALRSFAAYGDKLLYVQADTLQPDSLRQAVSQVKQKYGRIHGAVFSGMVFGIDNSIEHIPEADFRAVLDIKTLGSLVFHGVLKDEPLDFLCYFSSGQAYSYSGANKVCSYAAGITFTDGFVRAIRNSSRFAVGVINWGAWQTFVTERLSQMQGVSTKNMGALEDQEGFECFEQFVSALQQGGIHQVMCMRASREVQSLLNRNRTEMTALMGKNASAAVSLQDDVAIPREKIAHLRQVKQSSQLDEWFIQLLFFQVSHLLPSPDAAIGTTAAELCKRCGILDKYVGWMASTLELFVGKGYVEVRDGIVRSWREITSPSIWDEWRIRKGDYARDPDTKPLVALVNECLEKLTDILHGKVAPTDVIFPNASVEKVAPLYKGNATADTFNEIVANAAQAYLKQRLQHDPRSRVRILEIGAGTGGTSAAVFAALKPYRESVEEYCYTDLSRAFFFHAQEHYLPDNPYIVCRRLDIEEPIERQGIEAGSYDLVIATNVLHATHNIRRTLRNAKASLRAEGFIILNEMSQKSLNTHLTFALLDGWWLFQDPELRIPGCPGLYPAGWQRALEEEGFHSVLFPAEEGHVLGNQIVIARSDGLVRQPVQQVEGKRHEPQAPQQVAPQTPGAQTPSARAPAEAAAATQDVGQFVRSAVLGCLSGALKIPPDSIDVDTAFADYGLDSILGTNFVDQLNTRLAITLNTAVIFEYSSVEKLSKYVLDAHKDQVQAHLPVAEQPQPSHPPSPSPSPRSEKSGAAAGELPGTPPAAVSPSADYGKRTGARVEIAVIGMSGKFPKAESVHEFWRNLVQGVDGVEELPSSYLDPDRVSSRKQKGKTRCKWGGILSERDCFDPLFFNLSPREALSMNPHQRLVMQQSWNALEDAGLNAKALAGTQTGVFVGSEPTEYSGQTFTGLSDAIIASRLSYVLDLRGPAFVVNTGCSASAVALHLACESLRNHETNLALAGGVNACMRQSTQIVLDEIDMLSPTGRCFTFDKAGDGTIISEGVGMVVLKRLDDAIAAGDPIYGTIVATGINQDGASNGITAPNGAAQEQLITSVYDKFGIDPERISYVEAHGTGTKLGDPIETNALVRAFRKYTHRKGYCAMGSAKSHIGHTAAAAGVTGLIKVLLSMRHRTFPKLLNFRELNPLIELSGSPFFVTREMSEWKSAAGQPRMAAINSFGHSGTNAHLVVKEHIQASASPRHAGGDIVIPLSAKTPEQLRQRTAELLSFIRSTPETITLGSMAYTLQMGREAMEERVAIIASSMDQLAARFRAFQEGEQITEGVYEGHAKRNAETLSLVGNESPASVARLWTQGHKVTWSSLWHGEATPGRTHLPGYPFAKERYWIDAPRTADVGSSKPAADTGRDRPSRTEEGESLETIINRIADESLEAQEGVRLLRKIV